MSVDEFKKLYRESLQKNASTKVLTLSAVQELFLMYPHIWALDRTLRGSIARIAVKDSTDEETKLIIDKEYDTIFHAYPVDAQAYN